MLMRKQNKLESWYLLKMLLSNEWSESKLEVGSFEDKITDSLELPNISTDTLSTNTWRNNAF